MLQTELNQIDLQTARIDQTPFGSPGLAGQPDELEKSAQYNPVYGNKCRTQVIEGRLSFLSAELPARHHTHCLHAQIFELRKLYWPILTI